jgi:undecaprenyl-diphosphatase
MHNILLGIIQGLTEFLPVSSSGHLYLAESFLGREPSLTFSIILHAASLLAVILFFRKDIFNLIKEFFDFKIQFTKKMSVQLLSATFITGLIGVPFQKLIADDLSPALVATTLIITGALILYAEKKQQTFSTHTPFSFSLALWLGAVQAISILPGISRSGLTISFLLILGVSRLQSARISFLLSIPTIAGALVLLLLDAPKNLVFNTDLLFASIASFIAALVAIKWMMQLIKGRWILFAPYCFVLGVAVLLFSL